MMMVRMLELSTFRSRVTAHNAKCQMPRDGRAGPVPVPEGRSWQTQTNPF